MKLPKNLLYIVLNTSLCFFVVVGFTTLAPEEPVSGQGSVPLPVDRIKLPPGFKISVYAHVPGARSMALGPAGTLFVGTREMQGAVYAVVDTDHDGKADKRYLLAGSLFMPNGVAVRDGNLYVAEVNRVIRFDDIENHLAAPPPPVVVNDTFSKATHHGWKFIAFGPDNLLYVPVGAACNVCALTERYGSLMRMKPDGSNLDFYARGIRNTVGFDWHPLTKELWFTDNGRDLLGDSLPPDELNRAPHPGMNFGFPYRYGKNIPDPEFGSKDTTSEFTPSTQDLQPHAAALGMRFYTGSMFPSQYKNQIFIAEHGSWNSSHKVGYRVSLVTLQNDKPTSYETFAEGWLQPGDSVWGRPVDICVMADGSMLVSDDHAGAIYRITYGDK